jgi:dienelactone hydrolase
LCHYRGYRPSGGRPSAKALLTDSLTVLDHLEGELGSRPVVAVGVSIGSPVAVCLARHHRLAGLILVTRFDSIVELARDHYPRLPVRLLLRHRMPTVDFVRDMPTPTALIVAGSDTIVPPGRSQPLRRAISNLVFDATIDEAGEALARIEMAHAFRRH